MNVTVILLKKIVKLTIYRNYYLKFPNELNIHLNSTRVIRT